MGKCNVNEKIKGLDQFGQSFQFRLDSSGETQIKSMFGAILTVVSKVIMLLFVGYKLNLLIERDGATILQTVKDNFYSSDDDFTAA